MHHKHLHEWEVGLLVASWKVPHGPVPSDPAVPTHPDSEPEPPALCVEGEASGEHVCVGVSEASWTQHLSVFLCAVGSQLPVTEPWMQQPWYDGGGH